MEFRVLGALEVREDGDRPIPLGAGKQRAALAILLLHANEVVGTERLIDELWGESPPRAARKALQVYVTHLRKALGSERIRTRAPGYVLELAPDELDLHRFERLVEEGRDLRANGDPAGATAALREALALWKGQPLADFTFEPFAQTEIPRLEEQRLEALEERIDAELALGHGSELVAELEALVAKHPYRERLRGQLMLALYRAGRQADALAAYQEARKLLVEELGVEPSPALQRLEGAILRQEPALETVLEEPAVAAPPRRPAETAGRLNWRLAAAVPVVLLAAGLVSLGLSRWRDSDSLSRVQANAIGVIDADAAEIDGEVPLPGSRPGAIAAGGNFVWATSEAEGTVSRVDPDGRDVQTLHVGESANGVAYGARAVWVTNGEKRAVVQINPDPLEVVQTIPVGNGPGPVAVGEGAAWVANTIDGTLSRIDLAGGGPKTFRVGAAPAGIAVGLGAVWVTSDATGTVLRLDPRSGTIVESISVGNAPTGIAIGEGAVWVANRLDGTVSRIDPATNSLSATIPVGVSPTSVAAGLGAVWVANAGDGSIARIEPGSDPAVDKWIPVESSPNAIALADGNAWATTLPSLPDHRGGVLRVESFPLSCGCVDPAFAEPRPLGSTVIPLAYDGLIAFRRVGGIGGAALVPNLAVRVPVPTDQGRTYTFQLRRGVRYSDGTPVRASDVRYSLERALTLVSDLTRYYGAVVGAAECGSSARCDLSQGIEVDDAAGRITIRLARADADFLYKLTLPFAFVVPAGTPLRPARTEPIPGTGAYRIASLPPDRELRLVRNSHFQVRSPDARPDGYPDEIRYHLTTDAGSQVAAVAQGRADVMLGPPVERLTGLLTRYPGRLHSDAVPWTDFMFLNTRVPPFDDLRVRRALNYAVNRKRMVDLLGGTLAAQPTCQLLPPAVPGFRPYCPFSINPAGTWTAPDLAKAKALIAASGTRGMRVQVLAYDQFGRVGYGRYFVSLLRRLGYRSSLRVIPKLFSDYLEYAGNSRNRAQLGTFGWYADYPSAAFLRDLFSCASFVPGSAANLNLSAFCDPRVDAKMARAADLQASDPARANALWAEADRMVVDRAAAVPLVNQHVVGFVSERVGNYQLHPQWLTLLDQLWVR
jgi:YVTN family beta-propeller protein